MLWFYRLLAVVLVLGSITALQAGIGPDLINATSIEMGSAGTSDTTIARTGAGTISVEGTNVVLGTIGTSGATIPLLSTANTWTLDQIVPAEAYGVGWNGSNEAPTKNDVYDKIETIVAGGTVSDADYGDITVSSSGSVWDVDSDATIAGSTPLITLQGTSAGAVGPVMKLWHDSASPADGDLAGDFQVFGGADDEQIGHIALEIDDGATTTEDTQWRFFARTAGAAQAQGMAIFTGGTIIGSATALEAVAGPQTPALQVLGASHDASSAMFARFTNNAFAPVITVAHSRGGAVGTYTILQDDDSIGYLTAEGADGASFTKAAEIGFFVDGTPGLATDMPGRIAFATSPDNSATPAVRMAIFNAGQVAIGASVTNIVTDWQNSGANIAFQVLGTTTATAAMGMVRYSNDSNTGALHLAKSRATAFGSNAIVSASDNVATITFEADDGTDFPIGAQIFAKVDGSPGADDMPMLLAFGTTVDGASSPTTRLSIDALGTLVLFDGATVGSAQATFANGTIQPHFQVIGTTHDLSSIGQIRMSNDANAAVHHIVKTRATSNGSHTIVQASDQLGNITFGGDDGTDFPSAANIGVVVDSTPGANDMPGALHLQTTPDGSATTISRIVIKNDGGVIIGPNDTSPGASTLNIDANGILQISEAEVNGDNFQAFQTAAAVTASTTCTFLDQATFIPYGCIGSSQPTITLDGATTIAITTSQISLACTGAESIDTITGGTTGMRLLIIYTDTNCTLNDDDTATASNAIDLTGTATTDVSAVHKNIELIYTSGHWEQISESDN